VTDPATSQFEVALAKMPAPEPEPSPEEMLLSALEDCGVTIPDEDRALLAISAYGDEVGDQRCAATISHILGRLPTDRRGTVLRLTLLEGCDMSAREAARLKISKQAIFQQVKRLRERIFGTKRLPLTPL
jgi:hypothetical protein